MFLNPQKLIFSLILISFGSVQATSLLELNQTLQNQKVETENNNNPLLEEETKLKAEQDSAKAAEAERLARLKEIENKKAASLKQIQVAVSNTVIEEILLNHQSEQTLGDCQIQKGKESREYYIQKDLHRIRIIFANDLSPRHPTAQLVALENGTLVNQILQNNFDPADEKKSNGPMKAKIQFEIENSKIKILHAQFLGEAINDKFFSLGSSHTNLEILCLQSNKPELF